MYNLILGVVYEKAFLSLVILLAIVCMLSSCELPFIGGKSEAFQPGSLTSGVYVNSQADIMYLVPMEWTSYIGEDAARQVDPQDEKIMVDFLATNPSSGSTLFVAYYDAPRKYSADKEIDSIVDFIIGMDENEYGAKFIVEDTFEYNIAGKDFMVVDLSVSLQGVTVHEYLCLENSGEYPRMLIIRPSPFPEVSSDTFESMTEAITEI